MNQNPISKLIAILFIAALAMVWGCKSTKQVSTSNQKLTDTIKTAAANNIQKQKKDNGVNGSQIRKQEVIKNNNITKKNEDNNQISFDNLPGDTIDPSFKEILNKGFLNRVEDGTYISYSIDDNLPDFVKNSIKNTIVYTSKIAGSNNSLLGIYYNNRHYSVFGAFNFIIDSTLNLNIQDKFKVLLFLLYGNDTQLIEFKKEIGYFKPANIEYNYSASIKRGIEFFTLHIQYINNEFTYICSKIESNDEWNHMVFNKYKTK